MCIYAGVEAVSFFKDTWDVGRRLLRLRGHDDPFCKDRCVNCGPAKIAPSQTPVSRHTTLPPDHRQLARSHPDAEHRHNHESPTDQRSFLWNALRNPMYFLHPALKERRDKRTLVSVLPGWYEHYAPATLEALPPRDRQGKRVSFAEVHERTFDPKAPPCMVPSLEDTITYSHRDEEAPTIPKPMERVTCTVRLLL